ncbi:MAG: lycopene cyclase [Micrococcales bacterium]|nr:MAG: lycopene cyclase [Micrococcales bacterium]
MRPTVPGEPDGPAAVDLLLAGTGAAGLSLLDALARHGVTGLRLLVVDPVDRLHAHPWDRTWCFWSKRTPAHLQKAMVASWRIAEIAAPDGAGNRLDLDPYRYHMLTADAYARLVARRVARAEAELGWHVETLVDGVRHIVDGPDAATATTESGERLTASWVFDSRPRPPTRARTTLLQHFRGHLVRTRQPRFDAERILLMDFSVPQPDRGVAFGYCLPTDAHTALVEYTVFSAQECTEPEYDEHIRDYRTRLGLAPQDDQDTTTAHVEHGVIPMTDGRFDPHPGHRVIRIGAAAGATRGSTGYTFAAVTRQTDVVAGLLAAGATPRVPDAYPRRHRVLDAIMLRALADGRLAGAPFFTRLWQANPPVRVLEFLQGTSTPRQEAAVIGTCPSLAMLGAAASLFTAGNPLSRPGI